MNLVVAPGRNCSDTEGYKFITTATECIQAYMGYKGYPAIKAIESVDKSSGRPYGCSGEFVHLKPGCGYEHGEVCYKLYINNDTSTSAPCSGPGVSNCMCDNAFVKSSG